ncbi:FAD/NAD(P)-binding domain-containing protein [Phanerochaete sordida]|uniref:FAD/NAD(P)-binding domain-containing protein n=1 Tax=Phanerochaete sordida TaxID=48140 RepID=A0A9P3GPM8_9APHY|nr:FAD/NAD(P)-binding domain-containing protein [Phanerochaete sordida]
MPDSTHLYDVIVVGGGPAGCATALSLTKNDAPAGLRVLVLDDAEQNAFKIGESLPASARRTLAMLHPTLNERLAVDTAQGLHHMCTGNASAWAGPHLEETYALMNPYGHGWHLGRARFDEALREACGPLLRKGKAVDVRRVDGRGDQAHCWEIDATMSSTGETETFRARWIVDATGRKASIARKLGAKVRKHSDLLAFYALFTTTEPETDTDNRTLIEAAPSGWWYSARLPHGRRLVTYTTSPTDTTARVARTAAGFQDKLRRETVHIARALEQDGVPAYEMAAESRFVSHTSACSAVLEPYAAWEPAPAGPDGASDTSSGRGWCAVGDAALAFDPLSSQGIITALNTGAFLGGVLARQLGIVEPPTSGEEVDGVRAVCAIHDAYEQVRVMYDEGRAYYYSIVDRFEADTIGSEDKNSVDSSFWKKMQVTL